MPNQRQQITPSDLDSAINLVGVDLMARCEKHGVGTFASAHEIKGVLDEEYDEYLEAMRDDTHAGRAQKVKELSDIAVAAIFGIASIQSGGTDW
jgi:anthranilate phosphoribosyltransferase